MYKETRTGKMIKEEKWEEHVTLNQEFERWVQEDLSFEKTSQDKNQNKIIELSQILTKSSLYYKERNLPYIDGIFFSWRRRRDRKLEITLVIKS